MYRTSMLEAVFISDLHLNPEDPLITARFYRFLDWAAVHTKTLYILGDFFHLWPGDDGIDAFSVSIIQALKKVSETGVRIYFMHGNRDFLLGKTFIKQAGLILLPDPSRIQLGKEAILLSHGDRYCTKDVSHQCLIRLTRNRLFTRLFSQLPLKLRQILVGKARKMSAQNKQKSTKMMDTVDTSLIKAMKSTKTTTIIHGHTHKPALKRHEYDNKIYKQYILSDWDDKPWILCYDITVGIYFDQRICNGGSNEYT